MAGSSPQTYTYKSVQSSNTILNIDIDLHLPPDAHQAPVLLWFHGGGLLQGHRTIQLPPHTQRAVANYNVALVTADYRLAPQVGIEEIFQDVCDCIAWIRNELPKIAGDAVDVSRLAVCGSSAGGYLAFLAGLYVTPKPKVILPIYPITDPLGTFFITAQPQIDWTVTDGSLTARDVVAPFLDPGASVQANSDDRNLAASGVNRNKLYFFMMQQACLAQLLHLRYREPHHPDNKRWRISRNIREHGLPPTYVVHGDADRAVGIEQSDEVIGAMAGLKSTGGLTVEWEYERLKDVDHGFDLTDASVEMTGMYDFMMKHL